VPKEEWDDLVAEIESKEKMAEEGREVAQAGGLHIIGTERHEARRIDNQLRGRAGRQGDPGSSRFFLSLEDDLMRIFAGEWVKNMLTRLGMQEGEAIESKLVSRRVEAAQKKVEERNFDIRKNLLEYDEVMDEQRKRVYSYRQAILDGTSCKQLVLDMIRKQIESNLIGEIGRPQSKTGRDARVGFLAPDYGTQTFATWVSQHMGVELEARELREMGFDEADDYVKDQAQRQAETLVLDQIEENLPDDPEIDPKEWNWTAVAKWANARWNLNLNDRELKKIGRDGLADFLIEKAHGAIEKADLSDGKQYLAEDFGRRTVCNWVRHKFGIEMTPGELEGLEAPEAIDLLHGKAGEAYTQREIEFPVAVAMARFLSEQRGGQRYDRDALVNWANQRFEADLTPDVLRNRPRNELRDLLLQCSQRFFRNGELNNQLEEQLDQAYGGPAEENGEAAAAAATNGRAVQELAQWAEHTLHCNVPADEFAAMDRQAARDRLMIALDHRFRPEMHEMERILVLQLLDTAWKDHLYTMDHLRQGIGLRGYAQIDPKVEYKREGMRIFEDMWDRVADQVTDLVFRMEQADASFVGSLWQISEAVHEEAAPASEIAQQQQAAMESGGEGPRKVETIRNRGQRVGRNDPCPCGSGKKYKNCCLRKSA
jgi:preprotein translocase subunit SecA